MSTHEFPSGNALRDNGLMAVIKEAQTNGEPITAANISLHCRQTFGDSFSEVSEIELAEAVAFMAPPAEPEQGDAQPETDAQPEAEPAREPPTMTRNEAAMMVQDAQQNLLAARRVLADAMAEQKRARGVMSEAVMRWQRGGAPAPTREALQRAYIASEQQRKADGVAHRRELTPGPSIIDRHAAYSAGGDANTFARKQMKFGSHHRPVFINGKWERPRQRGTKVPSER
jgi:hypothetical protein